jgi:multiple sugar transport system permease protein
MVSLGQGRGFTSASPAGRPLTRARNYIDRHTHVLLIVPGIILLAGLVVYPVVYNVVTSFTNRNFSYPVTNWVGIANYTRVLVDPDFYASVGRTLIWTFASVAGQLVIGFIAAMALQAVRRGQTPLRVGLIIPWAFPSIVLAFSWKFLLDPTYGVVNDVLTRLHLIQQPIAWLGNESTALPSLIVMNIWFGFPFMMVALLAGMQSISTDQYESAKVDGATFWQELRYVTLPGLRNLIGSLVVLRTIWVFNNFDFVYLTTGGGPVNATETLPVYAFKIGWTNFDIGRMAAVSVVTLVILAAITFVYLRLFRADKES